MKNIFILYKFLNSNKANLMHTPFARTRTRCVFTQKYAEFRLNGWLLDYFDATI